VMAERETGTRWRADNAGDAQTVVPLKPCCSERVPDGLSAKMKLGEPPGLRLGKGRLMRFGRGARTSLSEETSQVRVERGSAIIVQGNGVAAMIGLAQPYCPLVLYFFFPIHAL
jgi:hypothetical protein